MTVAALVWARKVVPSPRTELAPTTAPAGMVTLTLALPVLLVVTWPTCTQEPLISQRMRTASTRPKPRRETSTAWPTAPVATLIRGATS